MIWLKKPNNSYLTLPGIVLESDRLLVRPPHINDWSQWEAVRGRNAEFLKPYEPTWPEDCLTEEFFMRRLKRQKQDWGADRGYAFLIFSKDNDSLIGGVNINNICRGAGQYATLGYWLDEAEQGSGYMAEALSLVIRFGFVDLRLHRFCAGCIPDNERSAKLLLKLGFKEEGYAEKYIRIDGKWQDHRLFGLPVEDWNVDG